MSTDTTLVLGATGKTDRRVLTRLRLNGVPVRPASRSSSTRFHRVMEALAAGALAAAAAMLLATRGRLG